MTDRRIADLIEQAFDYRGYVTVRNHDGEQRVGFIYDRGPAHVEMFDQRGEHRIRLAIEEIADVALTGDDSAAKAQRAWERRRGQLEPRDTSAWGEWEQRPVLIVVALPIELRAVARVLDAKVRAGIARGHLGEVRAIAHAIGVGGGAAHAIAAERPRFVISCGFAGALEPSLGPGDLVLASSVHDESGEVLVVPQVWQRRCREVLEPHLRVIEGELLCATRVAATLTEKRALARPGRLAIDLESWAVARAAQRADIPWLVLRAVVDPFDRELPAFTRDVHARTITRALRYALKGPRAVLELVQLGLAARTATGALQRALHQLAPVLADFGAAEDSR